MIFKRFSEAHHVFSKINDMFCFTSVVIYLQTLYILKTYSISVPSCVIDFFPITIQND